MFGQRPTLVGWLVSSSLSHHLILPRSFKTPSCQQLAYRNSSTRLASSSANRISIKRRTLRVKPTELEDKFKMEWPKVTLFGDSITRRSFEVDNGCWGSMIAFKLGNYFDVDYRGFEGYNSKWALELMPKLFPRSYLEKVEIFIPFFGHNDSLKAPMHVPIGDYEQNMRQIVRYLLDNGLTKEKIILMTPSWYHHAAFAEYIKEIGMPAVSKSLEESKLYSDAVLAIAKDNDITVLDVFDITKKHEPLAELFCDGIHFSQKGARVLFDNLMPIIEKKLETRFNKPLADLWHVEPFDQKPELQAIAQKIAAYRESTGEN